jgi:hypothetical protein
VVCPQCSGSRIMAAAGYVETPGTSRTRDPTRLEANSRRASSVAIILPVR